jgi:HNH endonuclease
MANGGPRTGDRIVAAIQAWADRTGQPPTANGWREPTGSSRPTTRRAIRVFGSWNAGVAAAGFIARRQGHQPGTNRPRAERR